MRVPADLVAHPLLRDTTWADDWQLWLKAAGAAGVAAGEGPAFSLYSLAIQAALDGAGVLMAHEALVASAMKSGALVAPFDVVVQTGLRLDLLSPERPSRQTAQLIEWLVADAAGGRKA